MLGFSLMPLESDFKLYTPGSQLIIDEPMVPFRGILKLRQYAHGKIINMK